MRSHRFGSWPGERGHAHVSRTGIIGRLPLHLGDQAEETVLVGCLLAQPAGRHRTGPSAEGIDLDAAIVGEGGKIGRDADCGCLGERRFGIAGAGFLEHPLEADVVERSEVQPPAAEQSLELAKLAGVARRQDHDGPAHLARLI